jgi:hypothetical protein
MNKFITAELDGGTQVAISVTAIESFAPASDKLSKILGATTRVQVTGNNGYLVKATFASVKDAIERSQHSTEVYHAV